MLEILSEQKKQWSQSMGFLDSAYQATGNNIIKYSFFISVFVSGSLHHIYAHLLWSERKKEEIFIWYDPKLKGKCKMAYQLATTSI